MPVSPSLNRITPGRHVTLTNIKPLFSSKRVLTFFVVPPAAGNGEVGRHGVFQESDEK